MRFLASAALPAALMFAILAPAASAAPKIPADVQQNVRDRLSGQPSCSIAIGMIDKDGRTIFCEGKPSANAEKPADENTVYEIGSISKVFTTTLLADAVERGDAALDDPISKYLPAGTHAPQRNGKEITLFDLATHRSGLPRMPDNMPLADADDPYADYTRDLLFEFINGVELQRDIGEKYEYSNLGVGLLGALLAQQAGVSYEQLMLDRITRPLGMESTVITLSPALEKRFATGHAGGIETSHWNIPGLAGAGAIRSTVNDMLTFMAANMGLADTPLAGAMKRAHEGRLETGVDNMLVALGWHVNNAHDTEIIWHNGGTGGFHSFCGFRPDTQTGVVVLTNDAANIDDIGLHLLDPKHALNDAQKAIAVAPETLDKYVGYYQLAPGVIFEISRDGGQLIAQISGQPKLALFAKDETNFFMRVVPAEVEFVAGDDGKVEKLILHQNGRDMPADRMPDDYAPPPPPKEIAVDAAALADYEGKYQLAPDMVFDVRVQGDQLTAQLTGQPRFPVFPSAEDEFFYKVVKARLVFHRDDDGKVTGLTLHQGGGEHEAERIGD